MRLKLMIAVMAVLATTQAHAGAISCVVEDGSIITGQVDGEANVEGLRVILPSGATSPLEIAGLDLTGNKMQLESSGIVSGERMEFLVKVDTLNQLSTATVSDGGNQAPLVLPASCVVNFKAGI